MKSKLGHLAKRSVLLFVCIVFMFSLLGCGVIRRIINATSDTNSFKSEGTRINEESSEILRCIDKKDKEGMKALFCEKIQNQDGFDDKIDELFNFIDSGDTWSYSISTHTSGGQSWREGIVTDWDVSPSIKNICVSYDNGDTFTDKYYEIRYYWHIVCADNKALEGIQYLEIELLNVETFEIGEYLG